VTGPVTAPPADPAIDPTSGRPAVQDRTAALVRHVVDAAFERLPADAVRVAKLFVLDTLGTLLAGTSAPACGDLVDQLEEWGGRAEATVLHFGSRLPAPGAVLANATLAEARDFDDTHGPGLVHTLAPTLFPALAMAELRGGATGRELLTAIVPAIDVMARLGLASTTPLTWTRTSTLGGMAAALAAGKLLGLPHETVWDAVGIAYCQAAGNSQTIVDGALCKRMQVGFAARAGVVGVALARRGITGPRQVLEGTHGYFQLYEAGRYRPEALTEGLGERYETVNLSVKPYPCARDTHGAVDAAFELLERHAPAAADVASVVVRASAMVKQLFGKPFSSITGNPVVEAILSVPYAVAAVLVRRDLFIGDFEPAAIADPVVGDLARRVEVVVDPALPPAALTPVTVEARMRDGRVLAARVDVMRGDPGRPLAPAEFEAKFRRCAAYARWPIDPATLDRVVETVDRLEQVADVRELVRLLPAPRLASGAAQP
jgi:2-methylcitrate dehydratase PrpD